MTFFSELKKKLLLPAMGVAVAASAIHVANANENGAPPETINGMGIADYLNSKEYWNKLTGFVTGYEKTVGPCKNPVIKRRVHAHPANPPVPVPRFGIPAQWVETLLIEGCENPFERRVATFFINGKLGFMPYVLGNPTADPFLQRDVINAIIPHARGIVEEDDGKKADVRVVKSTTTDVWQEENGMQWLEQWTLQAPSRELEFRVKFKQTHGEGTTYSIKQL